MKQKTKNIHHFANEPQCLALRTGDCKTAAQNIPYVTSPIDFFLQIRRKRMLIVHVYAKSEGSCEHAEMPKKKSQTGLRDLGLVTDRQCAFE